MTKSQKRQRQRLKRKYKNKVIADAMIVNVQPAGGQDGEPEVKANFDNKKFKIIVVNPTETRGHTKAKRKCQKCTRQQLRHNLKGAI